MFDQIFEKHLAYLQTNCQIYLTLYTLFRYVRLKKVVLFRFKSAEGESSGNSCYLTWLSAANFASETEVHFVNALSSFISTQKRNIKASVLTFYVELEIIGSFYRTPLFEITNGKHVVLFCFIH